MDDKNKRKYIALLTVAIVGIIACITIITLKFTTDIFDKDKHTAEQTTSQQNVTDKTEAPTLDTENLMIPDFYTYVFTANDKSYVYSGDFLYKALTTQLVAGKSVKLPYYDRNESTATFDGIPILFDYNQSMNPKHGYTVPDKMVITADAGRISTWENETAVYQDQSASLKPRTTVFWSCYDSPLDKEAAEKVKITATYYRDGAEMASQTVVLKQSKSTKGTKGDNMYSYSVELQK